MSTSTQDAIAAFLAKGGAIAKIDATVSSGITDRQFYLASKGDIDLKEIDFEQERADIQMREKFAEARTVGVSSDVAYLFATGQIECCSCADMVSDDARADARFQARRIERKR